MQFIKYKNIYFLLSGILIIGSLAALMIYGLNFGIDFTGGSILEITYQEARPSNEIIRERLSELELGSIHVQPANEKGFIIRMKDINENTHQEVVNLLREEGELEELRFESIGPVIGRELKEKTLITIIIALFSILLYIAVSFRRLQVPLKAWQYGVVTLIALFHDVLIPVGILAVLGKFYGVQISIPIIVALLTVFGYSVNDTVVVFDRIRENLLMRRGITFEETVNESLNQVFSRCINTSITTLFILFSLFFFGGETLKYFSLTLILGAVAGNYSSLFLAPPILVIWKRRKERG